MSALLSKTLRFFLVCYVTLALALFTGQMVYLGKMSIGNNFSEEIVAAPGQFNDFCSFYCFGKLASAKSGKDLYDYELLKECYGKLFPGTNYASNVLYSPPFSLLCLALTNMAPGLAYCVYMLTQFCASALSLVLLSKKFPISRSKLFQTIVLTFLSIPSCICIALGQTALLMLSLVGFFFFAIQSKRHILSGFILACIAIKPHIALVLATYLVARKNYKAVAVGAVSFLCLLGLVALLAGADAVLAYPSALFGAFTNPPYYFKVDFMVSIVGILRRTGFYAGWQGLCVLALGLGMLFFVTNKARNNSDGSNEANLVAFVVLSILLFSVHVHGYDCCLLAIPAMMTLFNIKNNEPNFANSNRFVITALALLPLATWILQLALNQITRDYFLGAGFFAVNLIMYLVFARKLLRTKPAIRPEQHA